METFYGKLSVSCETGCEQNIVEVENCSNCLKMLSHVMFLEQKVGILEDIINTSNLIAEINQTLSSNQNLSNDQTVLHKCSDVGVQTKLQNSGPDLFNDQDNSDIEYDGVCEIPHSFMLTDSVGAIEAPESLLSLNEGEKTSGKQTSESGDITSSINPWISEYYHDLEVSPISSIVMNEYDTITSSNESSDYIKPVELIDDTPFGKFSVNTLLRELDFTHNFKNRKAVYYGQNPYHYKGGSHDARDIPRGSYIASICSYIDVLFPDFEYNSALIHLYETGLDYMPSHNDSEECIEDDSHIVTISLGASRTLKFNEINTGDSVISVEVNHGDVFIMSKASQMYYKHEVLPDPSCIDKRISVTFRLIKPEVPLRCRGLVKPNFVHDDPFVFDLDSNESGYVPYRGHKLENQSTSDISSNDVSSTGKPSKNNQPKSQPPPPPPKRRHKNFQNRTQHSNDQNVDTIYISSSMFRELDGDLLSSDKQTAKVFYYPGANSSEMLQRLTQDKEFQKIDKKCVKRVLLLTGTNYIDAVCSKSISIETALEGIDNILFRLWDMFINAKLHIINILPRANVNKNNIVFFIKYFSNFTEYSNR